MYQVKNYMTSYKYDSNKCKIQCSAVIVQTIFSQVLTNDTPYLAHEGELWGVFCELNLLLSYVPVAVLLYIIQHYNGSCHNCTVQIWTPKKHPYVNYGVAYW